MVFRIVAPDDDQSVQLELSGGRGAGRELLVGVDLVASGSDHVETARVAVGLDHLPGQRAMLAREDAAGPVQETVETRSGIGVHEGVEQPADHVVASGGLSSAEDDADAKGPPFARTVACDHAQHGPTECPGKMPSDRRLVAQSPGRAARFDADGSDASIQDLGEAWAVLPTFPFEGGHLTVHTSSPRFPLTRVGRKA